MSEFEDRPILDSSTANSIGVTVNEILGPTVKTLGNAIGEKTGESDILKSAIGPAAIAVVLVMLVYFYVAKKG